MSRDREPVTTLEEKLDDRVRVIEVAVREALEGYVGRYNITKGLMDTLQVRLADVIKHLGIVGDLPPSYLHWNLLQRWFLYQNGWILEDDGQLLTGEGVFVGTIIKESVKLKATATVDPERPDTINFDLFEYELTLPRPLNRISIDITLDTPDRDYREDPITAYEFRTLHGHDPQHDDLTRINCPTTGVPGHMQCGLCPEHNRARFICGCLARSQT